MASCEVCQKSVSFYEWKFADRNLCGDHKVACKLVVAQWIATERNRLGGGSGGGGTGH